MARRQHITRAAAAVDLMWQPYLTDAIVVIGNAPTALYRVLELLSDGAPRPALIIGMPVGFVGAAEAKEQLIADAGRIPFITLRGRVGGSALASAVVNALSGDLAGEEAAG
jgi:precorrin isomerase